MLLLVFAIGLPLGWTLHEVRRQGQAVMALEELSIHVKYAEGPPTFLEQLRLLCGEQYPRNVIVVDDTRSNMTDAMMAYLREFPQLETLKISGAKVTDAGLAHLKQLSQLTWLWLAETPLTDAGLVHLQGMTQLTALEIGGTQVTDAGLAHLADLTELIYLGLNNTRVTDAGLLHLGRMTNVSLNLAGSQVTEAGEEEFKKAIRAK
jgi:hypothetical protein